MGELDVSIREGQGRIQLQIYYCLHPDHGGRRLGDGSHRRLQLLEDMLPGRQLGIYGSATSTQVRLTVPPHSF